MYGIGVVGLGGNARSRIFPVIAVFLLASIYGYLRALYGPVFEVDSLPNMDKWGGVLPFRMEMVPFAGALGLVAHLVFFVGLGWIHRSPRVEPPGIAV